MTALILAIFAQTPIGDPSKFSGLETPVAIAIVAGSVLIVLGITFLKITGDRERKFFELITEIWKAQKETSESLMEVGGNQRENNSRLERVEDSISDFRGDIKTSEEKVLKEFLQFDERIRTSNRAIVKSIGEMSTGIVDYFEGRLTEDDVPGCDKKE